MTILLPDGFHRVCVYGINVGPGGNELIGCRSAWAGVRRGGEITPDMMVVASYGNGFDRE